ncbi:MAG TPA: Trm112 family protein [Alloacidobacterium sp.]|nr:Trm112 family protein [Alloacidobacterium sp.]
MTDERLSREVPALVVCPVCHGQLRAQADGILCAACGRLYPVEDGIPVLLADRARPPQE